MRYLARFALIIGAAALFSGCGGSQSPIGATGAMSQNAALSARTNGTTYKVKYSFGGAPDGRFPVATLIDVGGTLYGTTYSGGAASSNGTVFNITPNGPEKVLYRFAGSPDGDNPQAGLVNVSGTFYGTTSGGGSYTKAPRCTGSDYFPCGTVFSMAQDGTEKVLHSFGNGTDGLNPVASLIEVNGTLYGTTENGGTRNSCNGGCGTVFSITPNGAYKVLHNFGGKNDGTHPAASLIEVKGKLYGTAEGGGAYHYYGTVFSITLSGREKVLHSFGNGNDGSLPGAGLIHVGGALYGTTGGGGAYGHGTVFSITPSGTEKVLHSFGYGTDGAGPAASLIEVKGTFYGTTGDGGQYFCDTGGSCGTVFSVTPSGAEKVLHSFGSGTDGIHPAAALIDADGTLYGTTTGGGANQHGTIFAFKP